MVHFSLFGIPVRIEPFFWVTMALLGFYQTQDSNDILGVALFMLAGFLSVLIHELGHALTGRTFGTYSSITLHSFGGYAQFQGAPFTRPQSFLVTAAGPVVQILVGLAVWALAKSLPLPNPALQSFLGSFIWVSIAWALLNLLPVLPLDGGQMLHAILGPQRIRMTLWITILTAIVTSLLMYRYLGSILFPIFMATFAWQAWKALEQRSH